MSERFVVMFGERLGQRECVVKDMQTGLVAPFFDEDALRAALALNSGYDPIRFNWLNGEEHGFAADDGFCSGHNVPAAKETEGGGSQSASSTTGERSPAPAVRRGPVEALAMELFRVVDERQHIFTDWDVLKEHCPDQAGSFMVAAEFVLKNFERKAGR